MQARFNKKQAYDLLIFVDISNYVLLEYGQPLHMFDQDHIGSKEIVVRQAKDEETMTTLDNNERKLVDTDIVISNGQNLLH